MFLSLSISIPIFSSVDGKAVVAILNVLLAFVEIVVIGRTISTIGTEIIGIIKIAIFSIGKAPKIGKRYSKVHLGLISNNNNNLGTNCNSISI